MRIGFALVSFLSCDEAANLRFVTAHIMHHLFAAPVAHSMYHVAAPVAHSMYHVIH